MAIQQTNTSAQESRADWSADSVAKTAASVASNTRVRVNDVTRVFATRDGDLKALGPVNLSIEEGQFVSLVGPSGCGKSTLLRIIAGLAAPSTGSVEIVASKRAVSPVSLVFQDYGIYPWKTVLANVRFGLEVSGVSRQIADRTAMDWLKRLGLKDSAHAYPAQLSGGMRQRVSIARALAVDPEILLMDEPFAALDAQLREILQGELLTLCQEERRTVIFVTHSLEEAVLLSDRVVVMSARPGRIIDDKRIPFERPRQPSIRQSAEFGHIRGELWDHLRIEVERHMSAPGNGG